MVKAITQREHYTTKISTAQNALIADEPLSNGGKEKGMAPMELLASSLAACTNITLRMYADKKGWDLTGIETNVSINPQTSFISRAIALKGNLTSEQTERLLDIANHCPVHKFLSGTITIHTTIQ